MSINIAREASEVLSFTSSIFQKRVRFGAQSNLSHDDDEASSSTNSTTSAPNVPCHDQFNTTKRGKPTLNEFRALVKLWKHGMVDGDAEFVAKRYSPSSILACDDHTFRGRDAIQEYYEQEFFPKYHPKEVKVLYGNVAVYGEQVHDNGVYDIMTRSGKFLRMKYTFVYARNNTTGRWRIVHHKTAMVCYISTTGTPIDNHATHKRTIQVVEEKESNVSSSKTSSEVIPWGSFPFENGEETSDPEQSSPIEEERDGQTTSFDRRAKEEQDRQESSWKQTSMIVKEESIAAEQHDTTTSAHKRRPSDIDHLVALLTGTTSIHNSLFVLNVNQGDVAPIERNYDHNDHDDDDDDDVVVPNRLPSQVDHLVGLLTGTKSVRQDDLILLSLNNKEKDLSTDKTVHRSNLARMRAHQ